MQFSMLIRQIDNKADRDHASYKITYKIRFYIMFTGNFYTSVKNFYTFSYFVYLFNRTKRYVVPFNLK